MNQPSNDNDGDKADENPGEEQSESRLSLLQMIGSTLSAALGVQSSANRKRDFTHGKPVHFIILGIAFTALFVLAVIGVVNLVLP